MICEIDIQITAQLTQSQELRITGDNIQLGIWDFQKSLRMKRMENDQNIWRLLNPIKIQKDQKIEFKCVIFENDQVIQLEKMQQNKNRRYKAQYKKVVLRGAWEEQKGSEIVVESEFDSVKKLVVEPTFKQVKKLERQLSSQQNLNILRNDSFQIDPKDKAKRKKQIYDINPYKQAEISNSSNEDKSSQNSMDSSDNELKQNQYFSSGDSKHSSGDDQKEQVQINSKKMRKYTFEDEQIEKYQDLSDVYKVHKKQIKQNSEVQKKQINQLKIHDMINNHQQDKDQNTFNNKNLDTYYQVCLFLPIQVIKNKETSQFSYQKYQSTLNQKEWHSYDQTQKKYKNFFWIGFLENQFYDEYSEQERLLIKNEMVSQLNCIPIFAKKDEIYQFINTKVFSLYDTLQDLRNAEQQFHFLYSINVMIVDELLNHLINQYKQGKIAIMITNRNFILMSSLLQYQLISKGIYSSIGFVMDYPLSSYENFRLLPYFQKMINCLVCMDLIFFNSFGHAQSFFQMISQQMDIQIDSENGELFYIYQGRKIRIVLYSVSVDCQLILKMLKTQQFELKKRDLEARFNDAYLIIGIDSLSQANALPLKFELFTNYIIKKIKSNEDEIISNELNKKKDIQLIKNDQISQSPINQTLVDDQHLFNTKIFDGQINQDQMSNVDIKQKDDEKFTIISKKTMSDQQINQQIQLKINNSSEVQYRKIKLVQIIRICKWIDQFEYNSLLSILMNLKNKFNQEYGIFSYDGKFIEIEIIEETDINSLYAFMSMTNILLMNPIKITAPNLYPLEHIIINNQESRQKYGLAFSTHSMTTNKNCNSIIKFNAFDASDFQEKLNQIILLKNESISFHLHQDIKFLRTNSSIDWIDKCMKNLIKIKNQNNNNILGDKSGLDFKYVYQQDKLKIPSNIIEAFCNSKNRVILLDFEGTLVNSTRDLNIISVNNEQESNETEQNGIQDRHQFKLSSETFDAITQLSNHSLNTFYMITSKIRDESLDSSVSMQMLGQHQALGLACESGFSYKQNNSIEWNKLIQLDIGWQQIIKKIMENYAQATEGSYIAMRESSILWIYSDVQASFGKNQANELFQHLNQVLEHQSDLEVIQESYKIIVRPVGINKGTFLECVIRKVEREKGKIDFLLVAGDSISDEYMFLNAKLLSHETQLFTKNHSIYPIIIGLQNSYAKYYMDDNKQLQILLEQFVDADNPTINPKVYEM